MSAAHLEELKKRYNFKHISVATWKDPRSSVLPARGGPASSSISPEAAGSPYMPTYKVSYTQPKAPEPTDDEASSEDEASEGEAEEAEEEATAPEVERAYVMPDEI